MIIASYYWGCPNQCIYLTAIIQTCDKGFEDMFLVPDKRFARNQYLKFINKIKKYMHQSGEHLTMFNIYNQTRQKDFFQVDDDDPLYINKLSKYRKQLCEAMNLVYSKIESIDSAVRELEQIFIEVLPQIAKLNLFNVAQFVSHERYLKLLDKEEKLAKLNVYGGGMTQPIPYKSIINHNTNQSNNDINLNINSKENKETINVKKTKKTKKNKIPNKKGGTLKAIQFKKKFEKDRKNLNKKKENMEKQEEEQIRQAAINPKGELVRKLNKVTLFGKTNLNIVRFKDIANNMLASLFFGYYNNIAYFINYKVGKGKKKNNKNYLVKHIDPNMPFQMATISDSIFDDDKLAKRPPLVIYNQFVKTSSGNKISLLSKVPPTILVKYGII